MEFHPYREREANKQVERLQRIRRERDETSTRKALEKVGAAARAENNVMPAIMDAVESHATVGEVCTTLKDVFGTYEEPVKF